MKSLLTFIVCLMAAARVFAATSFTEFYCLSGGTNINAGSTTSTTATYTSTNGAWSTVTGLFTPSDGTTPASTVSSGMWASVFIDAATVGVYVGRITNVAAGANGAISVDLGNAAGTAPTTSANTRSIKVGGAWQGPIAATTFPFSMGNILRLTNPVPDRPRINMKNNQEYTMSAQLPIATVGPYRIEGYTTTPGDGGRAVITGNGIGSSVLLVNLSVNLIDMAHFIIRSNGTSGTLNMFAISGSHNMIQDVVVSDSRSSGFVPQGVGNFLIECEAFKCGLGNNALDGGFKTSSATTTFFLRCNSHDNTNANISGFTWNSPVWAKDCIADTNGTNGYTWQPGASTDAVLVNCDAYNNGGHGLELKGTAADSGALYVENCNFVKNALWGMQCVANNSNHVGNVWYCGFGSGTQANGSGTVTTTGWGAINVQTSTFVTYTANQTPWLDPANGDFSIASNQAWGAGRGTFTETQASYSGTIGYPDIGAAQHRGVTNATASAVSQ